MNKTTKIFNNIGFYCSINNDHFVPNKTINGYQALDNTSIGYYIPYLVRNVKDNYKWEIGVGEVQLLDGDIIIKRIEVSNSSKNNTKETFIGSDNEFYLFVNSSNFNTNFHNVILKNNHFSIDSVSSIYIVDNTVQNIDCSLLDPALSRNLVVDIKPLSDNHSVIIRDYNGSIFSSTQNPIRLVCDGQTWYNLNENDKYVSTLTYDSNFSAQANPGGDTYSFQYNDGSNGLLGSQLYWSSGNTNKLLLGSSSESLAHSVIPTSGNANTIFNQDLKSSDFIVYGSGQNYRNLFFSYDGRVGINIPSGSRPQTIFHVVNYSCSEILRLENRTACQPAKLTLYHKPSGSLNNGDVCSIVNLAGKDVNNNPKDYAQLYSVASNTTDGYGGLVLSVSSGNNQQSLVSGSLSNINIGYNNQQRINLNSNGSIIISGSSLNASTLNSLSIGTTNNTSLTFDNTSRNIAANFDTLSLGSGSISSQGSLAITDLHPTKLFLDNLATGSLLSVSTSGRILAASGISVSGNSINISNVGANKILTTSSNGYIQGLYDINDYFLTEQDIIWTKFNPRVGSICLKQIIFDAPVPVDEFVVGDQVEIVTGTATVYRIVTDIVFDDGFIIELLLDQNVTTTTINAVSAVSITLGGYLTMQKNVTGAIADSTSNVLSIRPLVDTEFNTSRKDINFAVYGNDPSPAFKVYANIGSVERFSGIYTDYATNSDDIAAILINTGGSGINSSFSTANFNYNATDNLFSGIVSSVGTNGVDSYYGTYDQNGNVAEWIDPAVREYTASSQMAAGGSFETILAVGDLDPSAYLKSIEYATAKDGHDHIGFRVASIDGQTDNNTISSILGLQFVQVTDRNNIPDDGDLYLRNGNSYSLVPIDNLGKVDQNYRIGKYEVTNTQYNIFLNSVATGNDPFSSGLYISDMTNQPEGGIILNTNGILNSYSVKTNMGNKPVTFVSYINSLKYINWLHNGAPTVLTSSQSTAEILNDGAYTILPVGNNSYRILTNNSRKYFLPDIHQWHKAAYFQNFNNVVTTGYPVVTINTDEPYLIATEDVGTTSLTPRTLYGDITISGWLVVDKIFVKDGTVKSRLTDIGWDPVIPPDPDDEDTSNQTVGPDTPLPNVPPPLPRGKDGSAHSTFWNNKTSVVRLDGVYGETSPPLVPDGTEDMVDLSCDDEELIDTNNLPFWCGQIGRARGPYFYP